MGRGCRPVETLPDHGINIGTGVTKLWLAWLMMNKKNIRRRRVSFFLFLFFSGFFSSLA